MPQPIILQDTSGIAQGITSAGSSIAQGLQQRAEKQKKQGYNTVLNDVLSSLPANPSSNDYMQAYQTLASKTSPEYAKQASEFLQPFIKENLKRETQKNEWSRLFGSEPNQGQQINPEVNPQKQRPLSNYSNDQLSMMQTSESPSIRRYALAEQNLRNQETKSFSEDRKYHTAQAKPAIDEASKIRTRLDKKEFAALMARDAIESNNLGAFSWANFAERSGMPELQNASGAQLAQAAKINLVGNLSDVSARAQNQWIEGVMSKAFAQPGANKESNLMTQELIEADSAMDKAYLENFDRLAEQDRKEYGYERGDIKNRASKASETQKAEILKRTAYKTRQIREKEQGFNWIKSQAEKKPPKGSVATPSTIAIFVDKYKGDVEKAVENMKKLGYILPTKKEIELWQ